MSRSNTYRGHGLALVIALLSLVIGGPAIAACAPVPAGLDVAKTLPCQTEDGSRGDPGGWYPCVVDVEAYTPPLQAATRWTLYVNTGCPVATVQPATDVTCIDVREWLNRTGTVLTVGEHYSEPFDARPGDIVNVTMDPTGDMVVRCHHYGGNLVRVTCLAVDY